MKLRNLFYLLLALPLVFAACEKGAEDTDKKPEYKAELTLTSNATMDVVAEAGDYEITYTAKMVEVTREAAPATVEATCAAEWVTIGEVADTKAAFSVAANEGEAREAKIVVKYSTESFEVTVKQAKKEQGEEPGDEPKEPVAVTALTFGGFYTSGAEEESDVDNWFFALADKALDEEGDIAEGSNVYYVDLYLTAYTGEWSETMTLPAGEYTLDAEDSYAAGTFSKDLSLYLAAGAEEPTPYEAGKLDVTETGLTLTVTIEGVEHVVTYTGDMALDNDSEEPVEVTEVSVRYAHAYYNGGDGDADNFTLILSDVDVYNDGLWVADAEHYRFELYSTSIDKTAGIAIPYGSYMLDGTDSKAANTIHSDSEYILIDSYCDDYEELLSYDAAYITVAESGITAEIVLAGETIKVIFEGTVTYEDCSPEDVPGSGGGSGGGEENTPVSTLTEDLNINLTGASFVIENWGSYSSTTQNYGIYVYESDEAADTETGSYFMLDLLTSLDASNVAGEYVIDGSEKTYSAFLGGESFDYGCWYVDQDTSDIAPIVDGTFTIAIAEDGTYTLTLNGVDDAENAITGTIAGKLYGADEGGNEGGDDSGNEGGEEVTGAFVPTSVAIEKPETGDEYHHFYDDAGNEMVVNWYNKSQIWASSTKWIPVDGESSMHDNTYAPKFDYTYNGNNSVTYNEVSITFYDGTVIEFSNLTFTYTVK